MILMHHENALSYYLKESQFNGNHSLFKASHISELKLCGTFSQAKLSQSLLMLQRSSPGQGYITMTSCPRHNQGLAHLLRS